MSWETLEAAVDLLGRSSRPRVILNFFGGEPLLEFDLIRRAVAHADEVIPEHVQRQYGLCTNGMVLDGEKLEFLSSHAVEVQLSFDGVARAQEERAPGSFARLDGLLERMRADHGAWFRERFSIAMTLTGRNLRDMADSVEYFLGKGVREIAVSPVITHDFDWHRSGLGELDAQWERVYRASLSHHRETGQTPVVALRRDDSPQSPRSRTGATCSAGEGRNLTVDVDGSLWPCVLFCGSYQNSPPELLRRHVTGLGLGKIDDPGLVERLGEFPVRAREARLFHRIEPRYSEYGDCEECARRDDCAICPVSIVHIPGNRDPLRIPDLQCAFQRVVGKWRDRFPARPSVTDLLTGRAGVPAGVSRLLEAVDLPLRFD